MRMGGRRKRIDTAAFLVGVSHWLSLANYGIELDEAALDNDQINAVAYGLAKAGVTLLSLPAGLAGVASSLIKTDAQMDRTMLRVLGGLGGAVEVMGIRQSAVVDRLICFVGADHRDGEDIAACVAACARAGNALHKVWKEVSILVVIYWLRRPSDARLEDAYEHLPEDDNCGCRDGVWLVSALFDVNGPSDQWPMQPIESEEGQDGSWWSRRADRSTNEWLSQLDFYGSAIPELLELARAAAISAPAGQAAT